VTVLLSGLGNSLGADEDRAPDYVPRQMWFRSCYENQYGATRRPRHTNAGFADSAGDRRSRFLAVRPVRTALRKNELLQLALRERVIPASVEILATGGVRMAGDHAPSLVLIL
jgi:hypothetical protein